MDRGGRGQLFVIAGVTLALLVITVALVLNSGVYSGSLAAQNAEGGVDEPREFLREAEIGSNRVMAHANYNNFSSYATLRRNFTVGVHNWSQRAHDHRALTGEGVEIREVNVTNGSRITQASESRAFTNSGGDGNWTLGTELQGVRQFRLNVTNSSLIDDQSLSTPSQFEDSSYFRINISSGSTPRWRIYIFRSASEERVFLRVDGPSPGISDRCSARVNSAGRTTLYLTDGLIGNESCEPLTFLDDPQTPFGINYTNGDNIGGSYELFVKNRTGTSLADGDYSSSPPTLENAIYNATISVEYTVEDARISGNRTASPDRRRYLAGRAGLAGGSVASGPRVVYVNTTKANRLRAVNRSGISIGPYTTAGNDNTTLAPLTTYDDADSDTLTDAAFVMNTMGSTNTLARSDPNDASPDTLSTQALNGNSVADFGNWDGSGPFVLFAARTPPGGPGGNQLQLRRVAQTSGSEQVLADVNNNGLTAVAGEADIDGDPEVELIYVDGSQQLRYLDLGNGPNQNINNGGVQSSTGIGEPADFDGDTAVPFVDGSGNVVLKEIADPPMPGGDPQASNTVLTSGGPATTAPMASLDWDQDGSTEIVFIDSNDQLQLIDDVSGSPTTSQITDAAGNPIDADPDVGVR